MKEIRSGRLLHFQFEHLSHQPNLRHGVFARLGGVSETPYASLNAGLHVGDDPAAVLENRARIARAMGSDPSLITGMQQVHGVQIGLIGPEEVGRGAQSWERSIPDTDALVTNQHGALLMVLVADCMALVLYDPVRRAVGVAHGGWRGTLGRIGQLTAERMRQEFGTDPADLLAGISPSIGPCCYQVSEELAGRFRREFPRAERLLLGDHLDLRQAMVTQLLEAGLRREAIETSDLCTACNTDLFYSYRKEGTTGRIAIVAGVDGHVIR